MFNNTDKINHNQAVKANKRALLTFIACLIFVFAIFLYTIIYRIDQVTAIDHNKYRAAIDKYLNTESYNGS